MKFDKKLLKKKWFAYTLASCSAVALYLLLTHLGHFFHILGRIWEIGTPVFAALAIAYVLDPLVSLYSKRLPKRPGIEKIRHRLSVLLAVLTVVLFFAVLMTALVPQVVQSAAMFGRNLNGYVRSFQNLMRSLNDLGASHDIDLSQFTSSGGELLEALTMSVPENLNKILNVSFGLGSSMFGWLISFILAIYLMMDGPRLKANFMRLVRALLPDTVFQNTTSFLSRCNDILVRYIAFDLLDGLIIGICNWLFMVILRMPYVAVVSVIVGVTNLAPTIGPIAGAVLGAFILVLVNPWHALWFLLFTLFLQTLDGYVIKPRLFGGQLGVSSVWILIALVIGGRLLGIIGILLAIPAAAIWDFVYQDYIIVRLEKRKALLEEQDRRKREMEQMDSSGDAQSSPARSKNKLRRKAAEASSMETDQSGAECSSGDIDKSEAGSGSSGDMNNSEAGSGSSGDMNNSEAVSGSSGDMINSEAEPGSSPSMDPGRAVLLASSGKIEKSPAAHPASASADVSPS